MEPGEQFVMMDGELLKQKLLVLNLDIQSMKVQ